MSVFLKELSELSERLDTFLEQYTQALRNNTAELSYFFYDKGNINKQEIIKDADSFSYIIEGLYPGIDVKSLVADFLSSNENILIITGEPGIGKTTMVKYIIKGMAEAGKDDVNIAYCKDEQMVRDDKFWAKLSSEYMGYQMLILDDFDNGLSPRTEKDEQNSFVSKLLSFSDGVFDNNIKVLITTNRDIEAIDSALVRPGRCFDILKLRPLTRKEALEAWLRDSELDEKSFNKVFDKDVENVRQALLVSEMKAIKNKKYRSYLTEEGISVRKKFESGYLKKKVGFHFDD